MFYLLSEEACVYPTYEKDFSRKFEFIRFLVLFLEKSTAATSKRPNQSQHQVLSPARAFHPQPA